MSKVRDYFDGDSMAADAWKGKYQMKDKEGNELEETPKDMHCRLATAFGKKEIEFINKENIDKINELSEFGKKLIKKRNEQSEEGIIKDIFYYFDKFKYIIPQGSIMSNLDNPYIFGSLSNCFLVDSPFDSYGGIMKTDEEIIQLMKRRGGVGLTLNNLRPTDAAVSNAAKTSTGVPSFAERYSNSTREVAQSGRRGALMTLLSVLHPDIFKFIKMKDDRTKVTGANISVMFTDDFLQSVESDNDFICRFPITADVSNITQEIIESLEYNKQEVFDGITLMKIKSKELFDEFVTMAWQNAEPGAAYIDRIQDYAPDGVYERFKPTGCNPCQPGFAKVLTPDGIKNFSEINVGSKIWSETGWTTVINKVNNGVKPVYSYNTTAGSFVGTKNHRVVQNGKKVEVKDASSIDTLSGYYKKDELIPEVIMDGLVIGEGMKHLTSKNKVLLIIGDNDSYYHNSEIRHLIIEKHAAKDKGWKIKTSISESELSHLPERKIPNRYYYGNSIIAKSFLRGLFSANGTVVGQRIALKSTSFELIKQTQTMLSAVGIRSYYTTNKSTLNKFPNGEYICKESYDLNVSIDRNRFCEEIGFIQSYKQNKLENLVSNIVPGKNAKTIYEINSVDYLGDFEVFDITVDNATHTYWTGGVNVSNCGEIWMGIYDACRLIAQNLFSIILESFTKNAKVDFDKLYEISYIQQRISDSLVELEVEYIQRIIDKINSDPEPIEIKQRELSLWEKIRNNTRDGRRSGNGFTGLGDMLAALNLKFDSEESLHTVTEVMKTKMRAEIDCSIDMAILRGAFDGWNKKLEFTERGNELQGNNSFYQMIVDDFPEQARRMYKYGRRNVSWSTVAPTGTVSLMTQTTSGLEPLFKAYYIRRKKINPSDKDNRIDFIDQNGDKWQEYPILHPKFKDWIKINCSYEIFDSIVNGGNKVLLEETFKISPWFESEADSITWEARINMNSIIQKYTSNALSCTINLPKDISKETVFNIYFYGWKKGLKGVTIYRDGSRSGVLVNEPTAKTDVDEFGYNDAFKRPKELAADYYVVSSKGKKYAVVVGLVGDNEPYELFAFAEPEKEENLKGKIIKVKRGIYKFTSEKYTIDNLLLSSEHADEKLLTRWVSLLLRHGANPKYIAEQVEKSEVQVTSFAKVIGRILKKYIPDEATNETCPECGEHTMSYQEGCKKCTNCSYSKC